MARTCPSCGRENADDVDFCADCGGYLRWEPTRVATPVVPPAQPATPPPAPQAPPPAQPAPPQQAAEPQPPQAPAQPPPQPVEPEPEQPVKRGWFGREKKVPGVQGGGVQGPRVQGPRVSAPRVNVGPGGVNVSAPRAQAPRLQAPRAQAPRVKQPKVPTSPKGFMDAFKKLGKPGKGGGGSNAGEGAVAPQPVETWHWDAVGHKQGRGKGVLVFLLVLLFAGIGAAAAWYFVVREDESAAEAAAPATTVRQFVAGLEPLLVRSSRDRARIASAVTGVAACSLAPGPAAAQVRRTVAGRRAVLRQVRRVAAPNAQALRVRRTLERSLSLSATAGGDYLAWIASFDGSCPTRTGPAYAQALVTNRQAQAAKVAFAGAYNPLARRVGGRVWNSSQF